MSPLIKYEWHNRKGAQECCAKIVCDFVPCQFYWLRFSVELTREKKERVAHAQGVLVAGITFSPLGWGRGGESDQKKRGNATYTKKGGKLTIHHRFEGPERPQLFLHQSC